MKCDDCGKDNAWMVYADGVLCGSCSLELHSKKRDIVIHRSYPQAHRKEADSTHE